MVALTNRFELVPIALFLGALGLTTITENAALTHLGSLMLRGDGAADVRHAPRGYLNRLAISLTTIGFDV